LLIKLSWRALLVYWVCKIMKRFSFAAAAADGGQTRVAPLVKNMLDAVKSEETQTIFSHWRSMTHRYLRSVVPKVEQEALKNSYRKRMLEDCDLILCLARNAPSSMRQEEFNEHANIIIEQLLNLIIRIREQVATKNFEPMRPVAEDVFSEGSMKIADIFSKNPECKREGARVVCTIRFGLCYTKGGGRGSNVAQILVQKPDVVTQYAIDLMQSRR